MWGEYDAGEIEKDTDARGYPEQGKTGCSEEYNRRWSEVCYDLVKGPAGLLGILPLYVLPGWSLHPLPIMEYNLKKYNWVTSLCAWN